MQRHSRHTVPATLLAAVWIVTPVLSAVHATVEAHTYCAEHGTVEEAGPHHDAAGELEAATCPGLRADDRDGPERSSHAACAFGDFTTRDLVSIDVSIDVEDAPDTGFSDLLFDERVDRGSLRLLLTAPKTSPPIAG